MKLVNAQYLEKEKQDQLKLQFEKGMPFPYIVLDQFLDKATAEMVSQSFPNPDDTEWIQYKHANSRKLGLSDINLIPEQIKPVIAEMQSAGFTSWLSRLTGIPHLLADPDLDGGGIHVIQPGGFLNVHADFSNHYRRPGWRRRVNVLIYFNPNWNESWHGELELWGKDMKSCQNKIAPLQNRAVVFLTDPDSYHGHPDRLTCSQGESRKSLAFYYYTNDDNLALLGNRATHYVARPNDSIGYKILVAIDHKLIVLYSWLRLRFQFSDRWWSKIFNRRRSK